MLGGMLATATGSFGGGAAASDPAHGVVRSTDLNVTQNGTPNMTVLVSAGGAFIRGTQSSNQGAYHVWNDASQSLTIATSAAQPRNDLIIAYVRDQSYSGSSSDAQLAVVAGTPAASPSDPSLSAYPNALVLARVVVAASTSTITTAMITDLRPLANQLNKVPSFASVAARTTAIPSPYNGQMAYQTNDSTLYGYNGSSWVPFTSLVPHTVGRNTTNITASGGATSFSNIPNTTTLSITKYRADTVLLIQLSMYAHYINTVADFINLAVQVNGTDYLIGANGAGANTRQTQAGAAITGTFAAGTYPAQLRYRVTGGGGGTVTWDSNVGYNLMITETFL
jgi:hypothetical protein